MLSIIDYEDRFCCYQNENGQTLASAEIVRMHDMPELLHSRQEVELCRRRAYATKGCPAERLRYPTCRP